MCRWFSIRAPLLLAVLVVVFPVDSPCAASPGVVLNEVMYHPPDDLDTLQFVELFNAGDVEADLSGWAFAKGIQFAFPAGTKLAPGAFLVICRNRSDFVERYGAGIHVLGDFEGKLSHGGERLEVIDAQKRVVDSMTFSDEAPWPMAADGGSASLERICPQARATAANWAPSRLPAVVRPAGSPGRTNDCFSTNLPPSFAEVLLEPEEPVPDRPVRVSVDVTDLDGVTNVLLLYRVADVGKLTAEVTLPMQRVRGESGDPGDGRFEAAIPAQPAGRLVRYRFRATDAAGMERWFPSTNELRPTLSYSTFVNTNSAQLPFGFVLYPSGEEPHLPGGDGARFGRMNLTPVRGQDAFIYLPPEGGAVQTFDHVRVTQRKGGFKVRFLKDRTLRGMTTVNVIFEGEPRRVLSEPLAYEVYRLAGVPAELTEHIRLWIDGRLLGYHLLVEQPNKSFLRRHGRDDGGNLYKLLWYGRNLIGKHEKKTNRTGGHEDLVMVVRGLQGDGGSASWDFIESQFNVTNFINYFAVNMCIQNWDGFFNNYLTYHDTGRTRRWEIYPWDEDKTWGDYDGASARYDWYSMPLDFGMKGGQPRGGFGGSWWRPPGFFSGPLLANAEFRQRFLTRLRDICQTIFIEAKMNPIIDAMEKRLGPEIAVRAQAMAEDVPRAQSRFRADMESFRRQVTNRRKFILSELDPAR